jgi:hypothetical protein
MTLEQFVSVAAAKYSLVGNRMPENRSDFNIR